MFEFGTISDISADSSYVKVQIPEWGIVTEFIPLLRPFSKSNAMSLPVTVDDLVVVGRTGSGRYFVVGTAPNDLDGLYEGAGPSKFGMRFSDGCLVEYDTIANKLKIITAGDIEITADSGVKITASSVQVTGNVDVEGSISATDSISADIEVSAGEIKLSTHKHIGVQPGAGVSGIPLIAP